MGKFRRYRKRRSTFRRKAKKTYTKKRFVRRPRTMMRRKKSRSIPNVFSRNISGVITLPPPVTGVTNGYSSARITTNFPTQVIPFYKEARQMHIVIAVRRRRPHPTVFESAAAGSTVAAARTSTNNIYWLPWAIGDNPLQHPRQIRSARLLSGNWSIAKIKQKVVHQSFFFKNFVQPVTLALGSVSGAWNTNSNFPFGGSLVQRWSSAPYISINAREATTTNSANLLAPNTLQAVGLGIDLGTWWTGYFYVDDPAVYLSDQLEIVAKCYWKCRYRKAIGARDDLTGALDIEVQTAEYTPDIPGQISGPKLAGATLDVATVPDFEYIHGTYAGPPDPGDVCFPCGPLPAYVVPPPEISEITDAKSVCTTCPMPGV